jgi:signal peptidase I
MKIFTYILNTAFFLIIVGIGTVYFAPSLPFVGTVELKIVQSGSMEPSIMTGAVVLILPKTSYAEGDVITFADENANIPTTHRIVKSYTENGQTMFVTKGDANEEEDMLPVPQSAVVGRVAFSVPYAGYVIDFARQPEGFSLLIVMPALLIILGELDKIRKEIWGRRREGRKSVKREVLEPVSVQRDKRAPHDIARQNVYARTQILDLRSYGNIVTYEDADINEYTEPEDYVEPVEHSARYLDAHTLDLRRYMPVPAEKRGAVREAPYFPNWAMPLLIITTGIAFAGANFIPYTMSYFSDTESSLGNVFRAGMFAVAEPFAFSVTPSNTCFTYTSDTLSESTIYTVAPSIVTSYDVTVRNVVGDSKLCQNIYVSTGATTPVLISSFGVSSLSGPTALTFTNLEALKNGNRWCNADIVFSTIHEGIQYWATSTVQINDNSPNNSNTCLTAQQSESKVLEHVSKKETEIDTDTSPEYATFTGEEVAEEDGDLDENSTEELPTPADEGFEETEYLQTEEENINTEDRIKEPNADEKDENDIPEETQSSTEESVTGDEPTQI